MIELPSITEGVLRFELDAGRSVDIRLCRLGFKAHPAKIEFEIGSYTNKALIELDDGKPLFGELAILRLAEGQGFEGVWLDTYHQMKMWRDLPHVSDPVVIPENRQALLDRIRDRHGRKGGAWDVFVWRGQEIGFLESKGPGDGVRPSQRTWLAAAIREGIPIDAFTMVEWTLVGEAATRPRPRAPRGIARAHAAKPDMPTMPDFDRLLPRQYREKLAKLDFSPVMDNTLRRVAAGAPTYPSRVKPTQKRGLVAEDGTRLTEAGQSFLDYIEKSLDGEPYPAALLE